MSKIKSRVAPKARVSRSGVAAAKSPAFPVPQSKDEANRLLVEIAEKRASLTEIEAGLDATIAAAKDAAAKQAAPLVDQLNERARALHAFCAANRDVLTGGGKTKTVPFPAGTCSWRNSPGKVTIKGTADVIARLKTLGKPFAKFIRVKEEIDREAMLKDADRAAIVDGVTIARGEIFAIKPAATDIEELL